MFLDFFVSETSFCEQSIEGMQWHRFGEKDKQCIGNSFTNRLISFYAKESYDSKTESF